MIILLTWAEPYSIALGVVRPPYGPAFSLVRLPYERLRLFKKDLFSPIGTSLTVVVSARISVSCLQVVALPPSSSLFV